MFAGLDSPWAVEILRGVEEWGAEHSTAIAVSSVRHGDARPGELDLGDRQPPLRRRDPGDHHADQPRRSGSCAGPGIPLVVIDPANTPPPDIPSVGATNWAGGLAATEHLLSLGHRRIGAITGSRRHAVQPGAARRLPVGPRAGGLAADPALIKYGDFEHEGGFARAVELLDLPDPPTAIFAGSDQQAFGVYEAARQRGPAHPRRPLRRRLRRPAGQPLGLAADDHRAPAARGDGQRRRRR